MAIRIMGARANNRHIIHRPTVRPAHQRYPQPNFTFPAAPPGTAGLGNVGLGTADLDAESDIHPGQSTPTLRAPPPADRDLELPSPLALGLHPPSRHRRALSDSTVQDGNGAAESDASGFRVVISRPSNAQRPRTAGDMDVPKQPQLDINIPSWRIGVPRFTAAGSPMLRGSSYAPSFSQSDHTQSNVGLSPFEPPRKDSAPSFPTLGSRRPSTLRIPMARFSRPSPHRSPGPTTPRSPHPLRANFVSTQPAIEASMFDDLTFKPACDDRTIVRYAPATGAVTAATPGRLVAEITSPSFLDYELISDFFLTFRAFLSPEDLLRMLIARLRWAVSRQDEAGMIVHVRAFVALRHWILNYFLDDFVLDYGLRSEFCKLLNGLIDDLLEDESHRRVQLKILNELKKCWRRACALYWDGAEFDETDKLEVPVAPGGAAGDRDSKSMPELWDTAPQPAPTGPANLLPVPEATAANFETDMSRTGNAGETATPKRPSTPENHTQGVDNELGPWSPTSLASLDIVSCSFPGKQMRALQPHPGHPMAAHPIPSHSVAQHGPVATTPRALVGKRVRPGQQHQRSNSLPENSEERKLDGVSPSNSDFVASIPQGGSLVRGDVLPPGQAFVQVMPGGRARQTTLFQHGGESAPSQGNQADAMSGTGMRRLIGSVRRALSTRGQNIPPQNGQLMSRIMVGRFGATVTGLPGTAVVPQESSSRDAARPWLRIDLLGAEVSEDFKRAIREDASADADKKWSFTHLQEGAAAQGLRGQEPDLQADDTGPAYERRYGQRTRPFSDSGLTGGSKSIVIVDDTIPAVPRGGHPDLPTANPSVEEFGDALVPEYGTSITPPMTPQLNGRDVPRRSSHLLNETGPLGASLGHLPPLASDMDHSGGRSVVTSSGYGQRTSYAAATRGHRPPPVSVGLTKMHKRNKSSRTRHSFSSTLRYRHGSFSSGIMPRSTAQSFDATTYTRYSGAGDESDAPAPEPLRVLRRRPGGDLRAATNVDDLEQHGPKRSHSLGSLTVFSDSIESSRMLNHGHISDPEENRNTLASGSYQRGATIFSVGKLAEKTTKARELSLCSTSSSKPAMRPSFEAEAKRLAQIPDDEDGGVESALMKLEGKYDRPAPTLSMELHEPPELLPTDDEDGSDMTSVEDYGHYSQEVSERYPSQLTEDAAGWRENSSHRETCLSGTDDNFLDVPRPSPTRQESFLSDASRESYSSTPLLDGGYTDDGRSRRGTTNWTDRSVLQDEDAPSAQHKDGSDGRSHHTSFDFIQKSDSVERINPGDTAPQTAEDKSFLDSDLSSELSADEAQAETPVMERTLPVTSRLPAHPLGGAETTPTGGLPSPPTTHDPAPDPPARPAGGHLTKEELDLKPLPPTPEATSTAFFDSGSPSRGVAPQPTFEPVDPVVDSTRKYSVHLPFILAFDSDALAQQFTLIEKDALNEIDWKELVDMDWRNAKNHSFRSWVDFLRNTDAQGVEVVIARFNLVVKWAISEVVLTKHIDERVRCIVKLIHVASHCREYRNFATLAQLTIALSSNEVSRLAKTWELVPPGDMKTLRELENLVTPMRNFYNLRVEMESGPDARCIPFVGIYTHDLLYNAQRPAEIASSPTSAPLVNFERCRIGAGVVKTLLRLLEASTRYNFQPIEGITERCLWIGALSDEEIRLHSGNLE